MVNLTIRIKPSITALGQLFRMAAHISDWGDSFNQCRTEHDGDDVCRGGCVGARRNSRIIPTIENLRGGSFSFPPEPIVVKLLTA